MAIKSFREKIEAQKEQINHNISEKASTEMSGIGMGLLSETSKAEKMYETYELINIDKIEPNPKSLQTYGLDKIEELMSAIGDVGLQQPLVGYKKDGRYILTTGHRRLEACKRLFEQGMSEFEKLPMKLVDLKALAVRLKIPEEYVEEYLIDTTNVEIRGEIPPEKMMIVVSRLKKIYKELQKNGTKPKGSVRSLIAKDLGVSQGTVGRYTNIEENAAEEVKESFKSGEIDLTGTVELTGKDKQTQKKVMEEVAKTIEEKKKTNSEAKVPFQEMEEIIQKVEEKEPELSEQSISLEEETTVEVKEKEYEKVLELFTQVQTCLSDIQGEEIEEKIYMKLTKKVKKLESEIQEIIGLIQ